LDRPPFLLKFDPFLHAKELPVVPTELRSGEGLDSATRHNVLVESIFSGFNGIFMALAIVAAPVAAVSGVGAGPLELTVLVSAFPVGVFFGPVWATLGRRWGMRSLVTFMAVAANIPLFFVFWVDKSWVFTLLVTIAQFLNSAMRMGQSSLYSVLYPREIRGRVIGKFVFWTYLTMVPSILITGWLLEISHETYRILYPLAGLAGLIGCYFYHNLHLPTAAAPPVVRPTLTESVSGVNRVLSGDRAYRVFQIAYFLSGAAFFMSTHVVLLLVRRDLQFGPFGLAASLSVLPQLVLALSSTLWGRILDRIGIIRCRVLISVLSTVYLLCYLLGVLLRWPVLIVIGSILFGFGNSGGQLTWALGSTYFAPKVEDVPVYNGIHFVLNGIRGLLLPWVGSILFVLSGPWALLAAVLTSGLSILVSWHSLRIEPKDAGPVAALAGPPNE